MKRTPMSSIMDRAMALREPDAEANEVEASCFRLDHLVLYDVATGKMIASVDRDDLFDHDGNRFAS